MKYTLHTLSNGLRVVLVPIHEVESVTTLVVVGAGSRYENKKNSGISHFLEHMAFKGTKKRPTAREISSLIDGLGAESNAFTGKEITGYYIKSSSQHVDLAMDIISDMLTNLLLDPAEIEKEKGVILEEINLFEDTPSRKIGDDFEELLYGDVPMGWDIAGRTKQNVKNVTRTDFTAYMDKFYSSSNMTLVLAGKFDEKNILEKAKAYFSGLKKFQVEGFEKAPDAQTGPKLKLKNKKTEQSHFALGVRTIGTKDKQSLRSSRHSDLKHENYVLSVLASVLGGGMSSRLFHEVREKRGLAYYVRAYSENYKDVGYLTAYAGVDKNRIDEAIEITRNELLKVCKEGEISKEELYKAKEYMKGHFILDLEDTKSVAAHYGTDLILEGEMKNPGEVLKEIDSVTLEEVISAACKYLKAKRINLAIIGDFEDESRFQKLLT